MRYLRQALDTAHPTDEPYVLNRTEHRIIRRAKITTLLMAALVGVLGVLLLYWPQYSWPHLFASTSVTILGTVYSLPLTTILYGLLLVYIEVNMLIMLNLRGVKAIMKACQFPRAHDPQYETHLRALADAALQRSSRGLLRFGIDPYLTMPRWGLTIYFLLNLAKAALGSLVLKFLLRRFLGRFAFRQVTDLAGMPVYALWNAWSSWRVLHEAQIRVIAPATIQEFVNELYDEWKNDPQFQRLILEALQYAAIMKRQYNYAHHLLVEKLIERFNLETTQTLTGHFVEQFVQAPADVRHGLERLLIFGVLIDGRLSWAEKQKLRRLRRSGFLTYSSDDVARLGQEYNEGKGLWV
ncbi:hypothetical protein AWR27_22820 [Spirosoma montaniterrae]|uniref:Uncharacterized protein n=2 Tax=Spirosoma montaniterrae TaxID=1178516 RepID=A0A1P9X4U6_9BACT|nr:hypothetical protein AWR27_22820 [Spirosoma montaniterrae]